MAAETCAGQTIGPAATCTITVEFAPLFRGDYSDTFSVSSNDPDNPVLLLGLRGRTIAESTVLSVSGTSGAYGVCENVRTGDSVSELLFGDSVLDCGAAGLPATSGDPVRARILVRVDDGAAPVTGTVSGQTPTVAVCRNSDSGDSVVIPLADATSTWDCKAAGLTAAPGDELLILVVGIAN